MSATIMTRFKRVSADPADRSVIATLQYGDASCNALFQSSEHAQQVCSFIEAALRQAKDEARAAAAKYVRGAANSLDVQSD